VIWLGIALMVACVFLSAFAHPRTEGGRRFALAALVSFGLGIIVVLGAIAQESDACNDRGGVYTRTGCLDPSVLR
jgi:hypothetical protein